ncbi:MAG: DUF1893 domain-containing protein [Oscillospiraceae bacterium]|nr:DUF1893 domain-containing protein [Oscillospiraceae bacterium]
MTKDLTTACALLSSGDYTCVVCRGEMTYTATDRGVAPLLNWVNTGLDLQDFSAADRVVGRATAFLYVLLGVKEVYAHVMSRPAAEVLAVHGIAAHPGKLVDGIINRRGDGPCPFEAAVLEITEPAAALEAIRRKRIQLLGGN